MSDGGNWVFLVLMSVGRMLPMLMVWTAGLVIALVRWPRNPGVSMLVLAATVLAGTAAIGSQVLFTVLPRFGGVEDFARIAGLIGIASSFVHAGAWGCLLAAAFTGRNQDQAAPTSYSKDPPA